MDDQPTALLHDTVEMPLFGLGVFLTEDGEEVRNAVTWALEAGYRLVDTAAVYRNESGVGEALHNSGLPRDDVFITTKVWNTDQGYETTLRACEASLERLGLEYVDLYLIHWPKPALTRDTWRALEHLQREGKARAIGVSNFEPHHLEALTANAEVAPAVNQIELHPHLQQPALRAACAEIGTVVQAWSPLKRGRVLDEPTIVQIAETHGATPAQVVLRWQLQSGISTIPKSIRRNRIRENGDVFGFTLEPEEIAEIAALDRGERIGPHPDHIDF